MFSYTLSGSRSLSTVNMQFTITESLFSQRFCPNKTFPNKFLLEIEPAKNLLIKIIALSSNFIPSFTSGYVFNAPDFLGLYKTLHFHNEVQCSKI